MDIDQLENRVKLLGEKIVDSSVFGLITSNGDTGRLYRINSFDKITIRDYNYAPVLIDVTRNFMVITDHIIGSMIEICSRDDEIVWSSPVFGSAIKYKSYSRSIGTSTNRQLFIDTELVVAENNGSLGVLFRTGEYRVLMPKNNNIISQELNSISYDENSNTYSFIVAIRDLKYNISFLLIELDMEHGIITKHIIKR